MVGNLPAIIVAGVLKSSLNQLDDQSSQRQFSSRSVSGCYKGSRLQPGDCLDENSKSQLFVTIHWLGTFMETNANGSELSSFLATGDWTAYWRASPMRHLLALRHVQLSVRIRKNRQNLIRCIRKLQF